MREVRRSALAARQSGPVCRMDSYPRSTEALKREVSAGGGGSRFSIRRGLWPDIWPAERRDLKLRVAVAMLLLLAAKLVTIAVPFTFKWATDALTGEGSAPVAPSAWLVWALAAPIVITIAYGGAGLLMVGVHPTRVRNLLPRGPDPGGAAASPNLSDMYPLLTCSLYCAHKTAVLS